MKLYIFSILAICLSCTNAVGPDLSNFDMTLNFSEFQVARASLNLDPDGMFYLLSEKFIIIGTVVDKDGNLRCGPQGCQSFWVVLTDESGTYVIDQNAGALRLGSQAAEFHPPYDSLVWEFTTLGELELTR